MGSYVLLMYWGTHYNVDIWSANLTIEQPVPALLLIYIRITVITNSIIIAAISEIITTRFIITIATIPPNQSEFSILL